MKKSMKKKRVYMKILVFLGGVILGHFRAILELFWTILAHFYGLGRCLGPSLIPRYPLDTPLGPLNTGFQGFWLF